MAFDLDSYLPIPRLSGLLVSPGGRVVVSAATPDEEGSEFAAQLWEVDPDAGGAHPLTQPRRGEAALAFLSDDSLLVASKRSAGSKPRPGGEPEEDLPALWLLPAGTGEARRVAPPGQVEAVAAARAAPTIALIAGAFATADSRLADREAGQGRKKAGRSGMWFDSYPIRFWDHPLGPRRPRLYVADGPDQLADPRDLTGDVDLALVEAGCAITPDGRTVVTSWAEDLGRGDRRARLMAFDTGTGERRQLAGDDDRDWEHPVVSPDGRYVAAIVTTVLSKERPPDQQLWLVELATGKASRLAGDLDRWPEAPVFTADSSAVAFLADDEGRRSVYRTEIATGETSRLAGDGAWVELAALPDGRLVGMHCSLSHPPEASTLDGGGTPHLLHRVEMPEPPPGELAEVHATGEGGQPLRAWLVLPPEADARHPAPLAVFVHGGPLGSWNHWQWRWQPHLLAARGYAVLLPDPALSTGYGIGMVERGWGQWGGTPYTDVLALTDAALERPDLDAERTAVLGGSYGGYLTNWVIGHTDRFRCAVTHASLWSMGQFRGTTDDAVFWEREWGDPRTDADFYRQWSPDSHLDKISTPTLVVHGEKDYRVPISEGLRLWTDLRRSGVESALLMFPDEGHWVLRPGNVRTWYEAVLGWLDHYLLGAELHRPPML